ncbi:hypothetical protein BAC1_00886 [uncultured bacterium]|nr:hypothetical protein BAC1_00886 [uncultured bacterium]
MREKEFLRKACVAGRFYPGSKASLAGEVASFLAEGPKEDAIAVVCPHAGYMYSGAIAGRAYSMVNVPDKIILLGPNHTGLGASASVMPSGTWEIPTGRVEVDNKLASLVLASSPLFKSDFEAHIMEHSLEVQLPFIHAVNPNAKIVPVTIMRADVTECEEMGKALARAVSKAAERVLIVVSSDMNHYEPDSATRVKDALAIKRVEALDAKGLLKTAEKEDITMCGLLPAAIAIFAAKALGGREARLVSYATSGETSGDMDAVVGYAAIVIS